MAQNPVRAKLALSQIREAGRLEYTKSAYLAKPDLAAMRDAVNAYQGKVTKLPPQPTGPKPRYCKAGYRPMQGALAKQEADWRANGCRLGQVVVVGR